MERWTLERDGRTHVVEVDPKGLGRRILWRVDDEPVVERSTWDDTVRLVPAAAGVEMDVLGLTYHDYPDEQREAVVRAHPRSPHFKEDIIQSFYDGIKHKPQTTFGNVKADVIADKEPHFHRGNFCDVIRCSAWRG